MGEDKMNIHYEIEVYKHKGVYKQAIYKKCLTAGNVYVGNDINGHMNCVGTVVIYDEHLC